MNLNNYKVVVLERPYDSYEHTSDVREMMSKIWRMRLMGYKKVYQYGVLPIDGADWFSNHVTLCTSYDGELQPLAGFKAITKDDLIPVGMDFSLYSGLTGEYSAKTINAAREWVDRVSRVGVTAYQGGWTMCPIMTSDRRTKFAALEISQALVSLYYSEYKIPNIILNASSTYNVDKLAEQLGFKYLESEGRRLESCGWVGHGDASHYVMHIEDYGYTDIAKGYSEKYRKLWNERVTL